MLVRYKKSTTIFSHTWLAPVLPLEKEAWAEGMRSQPSSG